MFYSDPNVLKEVSMMSLQDIFRYHSNDAYQFLEIPYQDNSFSMYIILPNERYGLSEILKNIKITEIMDLMSNAVDKVGYIVIPKFEYESYFNLNDALKQLGIKDAFNENLADFSGICDKDICVSDVIHKAVIKVDEEGTKAAAATGLLMYYQCATLWNEEPFKFIADHPFLYFIADKEKNIYFIGTFFN